MCHDTLTIYGCGCNITTHHVCASHIAHTLLQIDNHPCPYALRTHKTELAYSFRTKNCDGKHWNGKKDIERWVFGREVEMNNELDGLGDMKLDDGEEEKSGDIKEKGFKGKVKRSEEKHESKKAKTRGDQSSK